MKLVNVILVLAAIAVACILFAETPATKELNPSQEYCEMWKVWHDSNGEYGWPDKNGVYFKECDQ